MISVLDTTAFSAAMRFDEAISTFLSSRSPGEIATVPPVVAEIEYGIQRLLPETRRRTLLEKRKVELLAEIRVLEWLPASSALFGSIKAHLEREGTPVDDFDIAIAAIASSHDAEVITANLTHFSRIPGVVSRHWT